jgi:hypothetical protein
MVTAMAGRIPLVRRPKAPALPLDERIAHLTALTVAPVGLGHHDLVAQASGVLNYAALIASDTGMPDLAAELCWRQHWVFASAGRLRADIAVMALMPLINISRLLTRQGDGEAAYDILARLYRAARIRETAEIHGTTVDLSKLVGTDAGHRTICGELWVSVLVDGARALARTGRWAETAQAMAAHRGIGNRLLDGRQIQIMSLLERGLRQEARATIDATTPTEPWENSVAALLRVRCRPSPATTPQREVELPLQQAHALSTPPDPATALFQTRAGLTALELLPDQAEPQATPRLHDAVALAARHDAHAAREALNHPTSSRLANEQRRELKAVVAASGLGAGTLPAPHAEALTAAAKKGERALRELL